MGNDNQHEHIICQAEKKIATEKCLQFRPATIQQVMPILTRCQHRHTFAYVRTYPPLDNWLWAHVFTREATVFRLVFQMYVYIAPEKRLQLQLRQHNPWLGTRGCVWKSTMFQLRSRYIRTVCPLRMSGWLEVKPVEDDSTIDYRVLA
jgi:hypothetical protein